MRIWRFLCVVFLLIGTSLTAAKFVGVGQAMYDVIYEISDADLNRIIRIAGTQKGGCVVISSEQAEQIKSLVPMHPVKEAAGGSIANSIAWLSRFEQNQLSFVYTTARDSFGMSFRNHFDKLGITSMHTVIDDHGHHSGTVFTFITPDGERTMLALPGSSFLLNAENLSDEHLAQADFVMTESYCLMKDPSKRVLTETLRRACALANGNECKTALTLSAPFVARTYVDIILSLLPQVTVLFGSEQEYRALFEVSTRESVIESVRGKVPYAVITLGSEGALIVTKEKTLAVPVFENIHTPTDVTGAGDGFAAGFLHGLANNMDVFISARLGNLVAHRIIKRLGASPDLNDNALELEALVTKAKHVGDD